MNQILEKRVRLIRSMENTAKLFNNEQLTAIIKSIRQDQMKHFLSSLKFNDTETMVSFARKPEDMFNHEKRIVTTFPKYVRRQLKIEDKVIGDGVLDKFTSKVISGLISIKEMEKGLVFLVGDDIVNHYKTTRTESCMTGAQAVKTELYALNPDKVSLLVMNEKIRALFWTCDDGTKVLDRIYPAGCYAVQQLSEWAARKGHVQRVNIDKAPCSYSHEPLNDGMIHQVTMRYNNYVPYMDTFKAVISIDKVKQTVVLTNGGNGAKYYLIDGHGNLPWGRLECYNCGSHLSRDNCFAITGGSYICNSCYDNHYKVCSDCGIIYHKNDIILFYKNNICVCSSCLNKNWQSCNDCGEYFAKKSEVEITGTIYCSACLEKAAKIIGDSKILKKVHKSSKRKN